MVGILCVGVERVKVVPEPSTRCQRLTSRSPEGVNIQDVAAIGPGPGAMKPRNSRFKSAVSPSPATFELDEPNALRIRTAAGMGSPARAPCCRKACSSADSIDENGSATATSPRDEGRAMNHRSKIHAVTSRPYVASGEGADSRCSGVITPAPQADRAGPSR